MAFYGAYAWIVLETAAKRITLGDMTMYLLVFKQGQAALASILTSIGGMYEDSLYLSNLYEYLEYEAPDEGGSATEGPKPGDGIRFENVSFTYPGVEAPALRDVSLHLRSRSQACAGRRERRRQDHPDQAPHPTLSTDRRPDSARRARARRLGRRRASKDGSA